MKMYSQAELLNSIRKEFFALRNGLIADTLRKGGLKQRYIFGLQLPQIKEMAARLSPDDSEEAAAIARALWTDIECREARLLACHLMPPSLMSKEEALEWAQNVATREEADILAFRIIRYLPFASEIAQELADSDCKLKKYSSSAVMRFL